MEAPLNTKAKRVIRVAQPSMTKAEADAAHAAIMRGQISAGPEVARFEQRFAQMHNRKYGVTCNSGTTALELALRAMNVGKGHKVAMPTMTMVACANAVLHVGAEPVFVDSEPQTGNADWLVRIGGCHIAPVHADAYIAVHLYGVPCCIDDLPKERTIIDCAEAPFASYPNGKSAGSLGRFACMSGYANKPVTFGGEGGIVLTDNDDDEERMRSLRAHAFTAGEHFHHKEEALGCRLTDVQAAIGNVQLDRVDWLLTQREQVASWYRQSLDCWWLETMMRPPGSVWWVYPVLIRKGAPYTRDDVRRYLHEHGVETRSFFKPMHQQPHLKRFATGKYPVADDLFDRGFYLPLWPDLQVTDIDYICDLLGEL